MFVLINDGYIINLNYVVSVYYTITGVTLYWQNGDEDTYTGVEFDNIMNALEQILFKKGEAI